MSALLMPRLPVEAGPKAGEDSPDSGLGSSRLASEESPEEKGLDDAEVKEASPPETQEEAHEVHASASLIRVHPRAADFESLSDEEQSRLEHRRRHDPMGLAEREAEGLVIENRPELRDFSHPQSAWENRVNCAVEVTRPAPPSPEMEEGTESEETGAVGPSTSQLFFDVPYELRPDPGQSFRGRFSRGLLCRHCRGLFYAALDFELHMEEDHAGTDDAFMEIALRSCDRVPLTLSPQWRRPKFVLLDANQASLVCTRCGSGGFGLRSAFHAHILDCRDPECMPKRALPTPSFGDFRRRRKRASGRKRRQAQTTFAPEGRPRGRPRKRPLLLDAPKEAKPPKIRESKAPQRRSTRIPTLPERFRKPSPADDAAEEPSGALNLLETAAVSSFVPTSPPPSPRRTRNVARLNGNLANKESTSEPPAKKAPEPLSDDEVEL